MKRNESVSSHTKEMWKWSQSFALVQQITCWVTDTDFTARNFLLCFFLAQFWLYTRRKRAGIASNQIMDHHRLRVITELTGGMIDGVSWGNICRMHFCCMSYYVNFIRLFIYLLSFWQHCLTWPLQRSGHHEQQDAANEAFIPPAEANSATSRLLHAQSWQKIHKDASIPHLYLLLSKSGWSHMGFSGRERAQEMGGNAEGQLSVRHRCTPSEQLMRTRRSAGASVEGGRRRREEGEKRPSGLHNREFRQVLKGNRHFFAHIFIIKSIIFLKKITTLLKSMKLP